MLIRSCAWLPKPRPVWGLNDAAVGAEGSSACDRLARPISMAPALAPRCGCGRVGLLAALVAAAVAAAVEESPEAPREALVACRCDSAGGAWQRFRGLARKAFTSNFPEKMMNVKAQGPGARAAKAEGRSEVDTARLGLGGIRGLDGQLCSMSLYARPWRGGAWTARARAGVTRRKFSDVAMSRRPAQSGRCLPDLVEIEGLGPIRVGSGRSRPFRPNRRIGPSRFDVDLSSAILVKCCRSRPNFGILGRIRPTAGGFYQTLSYFEQDREIVGQLRQMVLPTS